MNCSFKGILAAASIGLASSVSAVELPQQHYLPVELAQQLASETLAACVSDGYNVSVAVVDRQGVLKALLRGDNAGPHTVESSRKKAFTSASMGAPTAKFANMIGEKPFLAGLRDMDPNMLILGGGLPVVVNGERIGGIGVGGAPGGHLDEACAQKALDRVL